MEIIFEQVLFRRKNFLQNKIVKSVVGVFFLWFCPWRAGDAHCTAEQLVFGITQMCECNCGWKTSGGGFESAVGYLFYIFLDTPKHILMFQ